MKIFMVFLTMYYISWGLGYFYENSQIESDNAMWYIQNAQVMECFSLITSAFSNYLFDRKFFIFTHIMKIFMVFPIMYYMSRGTKLCLEEEGFQIFNINILPVTMAILVSFWSSRNPQISHIALKSPWRKTRTRIISMNLGNFSRIKFVTKLQKMRHGCEKNRLILNLQFRVQKCQAWITTNFSKTLT